jgi:glycosyltransferase involved in cell wall biosynthesis
VTDKFTHRFADQLALKTHAVRGKQKILISSYRFDPSVGGIETVALIVAEELAKRGYDIKVITQTPAQPSTHKQFLFPVIRCPTPLQTLDLVRGCDLFLLNNNDSLRAAWPLLTIRKPAIVVHHQVSRLRKGSMVWQEPLKHYLHHRAKNISVSHALAKQLGAAYTVVSNPYRNDLFFEMPEVKREHELVFLGRLDHQKGLDLLLKALSLLKDQALTPRLTVIGTGIEEKNFRRLSQDLDISIQVNFVGERTGLELVRLLNMHQIMVIPSRPFEAFGIVALEGIACGCAVLGSAQGGLPEAIGPCGETFASQNIRDLAMQLSYLLNNPESLSVYRSKAEEHLSHFRRDSIASSYMAVVERTLDSAV